jgi:tetratricopeptide (TPR) repeat protein
MRRALIVLLLLTGTAVAQTPTLTPQEQAQAKFAEGKSHYDLAEWDEAVAAFKEAYRLDPDPLFLFNVAQSYRQKGDCSNARTFYKTYLREAPDAYNREKVEKRIEEMNACAKEPEPEPEVVPEKQPDPIIVENKPPEPKSRPHKRNRLRLQIGLGVTGAGVLVTSLGVYFVFSAAAYARDLEALCSDMCDADGAGIQDIDRKGKQSERNAAYTFAGAGALLAAGIGLLVWDKLDSDASREVTVAPTQGGAMVGTRVHF